MRALTDWHAEDHEQTMLALGLSSKREVTRTRVRVRAAMATQTLEQGRYLGDEAQIPRLVRQSRGTTGAHQREIRSEALRTAEISSAG